MSAAMQENAGACPDLGSAPVVGQNHTGAGAGGRLIEERKLTIPEAAKAMGIGANSLRRIIRQGRLPILNFQKKTLILESDVEEFLRSSRVVVQAAARGKAKLPALPAEVIHSTHLRDRRAS